MTEDTEFVRAIEQVELAEQELRQARARLVALRDKISEPPKGWAVKFHVRYTADGDVYTYLAYRGTANHWYVTGKDGWIPWESVLKMMRRDYRIKAGTARLSFYLCPPESRAWEHITTD